MKFFLLFLIGLISGIISGMGIGGGAVLIPALCILLDFEQKTAQNINLIYFIPTAIIALITHCKNKNVEKNGLFKVIIFGCFGAILGSFLVIYLDNKILSKIFGYFLIFMGILEFFKKGIKKMDKEQFEKLKQEFINSDTDKKIEIYITAEGLTQLQYKELLKAYPYKEIDKLEKALA